MVTVWSVEHGLPMAAAPASSVARSIVVAELFTSEGCSSCPPADDVTEPIRATAGVGRRGVSGLVSTSTTGTGWVGEIRLPPRRHSSRQSNYDARVFHRNEVYTPQLVIDGRFECIGSDVDGIHRAITQAAAGTEGPRRGHDRSRA